MFQNIANVVFVDILLLILFCANDDSVIIIKLNMSINEGSRELMLYYSCLFIILTQFAGNNTIVQQVQVKGKGFKKWLFKPSMPLR